MDEVGLLLLVVIVDAGGVPGRQHDRVDAERRHADLVADLAEPGPLAHPVKARHRIALAADRLAHA
jgi:hypothetical protein